MKFKAAVVHQVYEKILTDEQSTLTQFSVT